MAPRKRHPKVAREQTPTPFAAILERLLRHSPGVRTAALIDPEGETVDYAGELPDYFTKLVSAHFRIVIDDVTGRFAKAQLARPHQIAVRTGVWTFTVRRLPDGYGLVLILRRRAFTLSARALAVCDDELAREAGWDTPRMSHKRWYALEVEPSPADRRRPARLRLESNWYNVEILGRVVGGERAYRCRLRSGAEFTLVRESSGRWFSEESVSHGQTKQPPPTLADSGRETAGTGRPDPAATTAARQKR